MQIASAFDSDIYPTVLSHMKNKILIFSFSFVCIISLLLLLLGV